MKTRFTLGRCERGEKVVERYRERLVFVRYRYDEERRKRIRTVERIEEKADWAPPGVLHLAQID